MTAAKRYGMDIARVLAEAGLSGPAPPLPPGGELGPLSGIWLSEYAYPSEGRGELIARHYVVLRQDGVTLTARSVPASASQLSMSLSVNGQVASGSWAERTEPGGHYEGAVYHGVIQLIVSDDRQRMEGKWAGFGSDGVVNTGRWSLTLADADASAAERWNQVPET